MQCHSTEKAASKLKDPRSFTIPRAIGDITFDIVLCDLGASINLMPLSVFRKLGIGEVKPTTISCNMEEDEKIPLILGCPFLATGKALIDVQAGKLIMRVQEEEVTFNVFETLKVPSKQDSCFKIDSVDQSVIKASKIDDPKSPIKGCMVKSRQFEDENHKPEVYTTSQDGPQ
ncbi:uncharacterized protein LOC116130504 [Pistacia vera]|uniref:uncharacterized protein LOC116130504 n=1 Tax=Pistacia vera TaxID=55513 RepID=UPI001262FB4C|nr:uncharacterized protein LOC116130504 [Pistacia vera]